MVPLFPLICSDRCIYSGLNYYHEQLNDGHFLYNNARSLLWGAQLGWIQPEWLMKEENGTARYHDRWKSDICDARMEYLDSLLR